MSAWAELRECETVTVTCVQGVVTVAVTSGVVTAKRQHAAKAVRQTLLDVVSISIRQLLHQVRYTPKPVAACALDLGVSTERLTSTIQHLGIWESERHMPVRDGVRVPSEEALSLIRRELKSRGLIPVGKAP